MKPEFCSEFDENDVHWVHAGSIPIARSYQAQSRPSKAVLAIIYLLEQGRFPVIKIHPDSEVPLKESYNVHEAYLRCHISVIPTVSVEERNVADANNLDPAPEPQERDWNDAV